MRLREKPKLLFSGDEVVMTLTASRGSVQELQKVCESVDELDKNYTLELKKERKHRSLNANNYSWKLTSLLADALRISKEECHLMLLARYGQPALDGEGNPIIVSVLSNVPYEALARQLGYIAPIRTGIANNREFMHYRVLRPSHTYDTKEMATFIDGIISECEELGIETLPPDEIERMKAAWKGEIK